MPKYGFFFFFAENLIYSPQSIRWCLSIELIITDDHHLIQLWRDGEMENATLALETGIHHYMTKAVLNKIPILGNNQEIG